MNNIEPLVPSVTRKPPLRPIYRHLRAAALNTLLGIAAIAACAPLIFALTHLSYRKPDAAAVLDTTRAARACPDGWGWVSHDGAATCVPVVNCWDVATVSWQAEACGDHERAIELAVSSGASSIGDSSISNLSTAVTRDPIFDTTGGWRAAMHAPTSCRLLAPDEDRPRVRVVTDVDGYEYECPPAIVVANPPTSVWNDPLFAPSPPTIQRGTRR